MSSIAARLDRLPVTSTHRRLVAIAGIGAFFDLFDVFLAGVLGTVLTERFHLSRLALPAVLGSGFLGMFIGATVLGWLADRAGRRRAFLINLAIYSGFTFLGAFSTGAAMLVVTRFAAGIGIGAEPPLIDAYLSEFLPPPVRGRFTAIAYTIAFAGVPAVGFLARVLVPVQWLGVEGWRWLFVAGSLGGAIVWVLRAKLPESPRWLESTGRVADADAIVSAMEVEAGVTAPAVDVVHADAGMRADGSLAALFAPPYVRRTLVLWVFQLLQTVGYYGFGTLVPLVLASKGIAVMTSLTYTSVAFLGYPIGSVLSLPFVERLDRRWLIVGSALGMAVSGLGLGVAQSGAAIVACGLAYTIISNIFSNAFHIFQAEIFPTFMRATATGTAYGLSRLSSAAMPFVLLPVLQVYGATSMFALVALAMILVMVDIGFFAPSTTGKRLEAV